MRKLDKPVPDTYQVFWRQIRRMARGNQALWHLLQAHGALGVPVSVCHADARQLPVADNAAALIVTSLPYATSYAYADLHQLSALWFGWANDLSTFRQVFIGCANAIHDPDTALGSPLAAQIVAQMNDTCPRKAREVALYFAKMYACCAEMQRVLRNGGYACIVIGNANLCEVSMQNAQVFAEQRSSLGFAIQRAILRDIPSRILLHTRDKATGKFTKAADANYAVYPVEYVLVVRKEAS